MKKVEVKKTNRGFNFIEFEDFNRVKCSIQESSIATDNCIWFGADEIGLREFVAYRQPDSWIDLPQFDSERSMEHSYIANNRMHLSQDQVKELLPILKKFAKTGQL